MNRQALAKAIAERVGISPKQADDALLAMTDIIGFEVMNDRSVHLVSFGHFVPMIRKPRESVHPRNPNERCHVDALRVIRFRPGLSLKKKVRLCQP